MTPGGVDVVVVAYRSEATLADCLASVAGTGRVIVVDNASPDSSASVAAGAGVEVVAAGQNRGFGAGANLGARAGSAPWILFLNPDAVPAPGTVAGLAAYGAAHDGVAVVASEVASPSGRGEPVRRRFPRWWRAPLEPGLAGRLDERHYARRPGPGPADWVCGACLMVRREAFEAVGGFDESFFLYSEETDLCARLTAAGWAVHWVPGLPTRHLSGHSTSTLPASGKLEWARGLDRYVARHDAHPGLYRAALAVGLWGRAAAWSLARRRDRARVWAGAARVVSPGRGRRTSVGVAA